MLHYILQVIIFQLVFLLVYEFWLKKETFFTLNRWYLLVTPIISFLLPLLKIEGLAALVPADSVAVISQVWLPEVILGAGAQPERIQQLPAVNITAQATEINWWLVLYLSGFTFGFILLLKKYFSLKKLFRFSIISEDKKIKIIEIPDSKLACTFFNTVFLGEKLADAERQQILKHELVHVKEKHSFDLVFFEVLKLVFWFNPLMYLYQSRLATLHEFIADAKVLQSVGKKSYYEQLLNTAFNTQNISFINQFFNHSLIKKRIVMLQKSKSKTIAKMKYLVVLPLLLLMLTYVSCSDDKEELNDDLSISEQLAEIKTALEDGKQLNNEEVRQFLEIMEQVKQTTPPPPPLPPNMRNGKSNDHGNDIPFAVIDEVPVFPGCEDLNSEAEKKDCMSKEINQFVNKNFNTDEMQKYAEPGINRVIVQFKIDENGNIQKIKSRAANPKLEAEAKRIISELPKMKPGKQQGKAVNTMYSLPIVFQVNE
ncbi:Signal transducer regulating beta-lactamase production, contains metallopeptidase domain [Salegentibacter echinorum]|uniref:Signal transducer regulating beta-lactamase production, contains metallopeptidase domain n=1 Tax=Salegentibacter echinorum TaxID=1073325 RepID=A0A1M5JTJ7_SALEC|nr:M56 family metallopeptidase [Salegentibacter echinorum]SHG43590.1 Signal transducer regulating beta-lactamase production, contains metallopeptidase domain [Salegentibacter echinorum]